MRRPQLISFLQSNMKGTRWKTKGKVLEFSFGYPETGKTRFELEFGDKFMLLHACAGHLEEYTEPEEFSLFQARKMMEVAKDNRFNLDYLYIRNGKKPELWAVRVLFPKDGFTILNPVHRIHDLVTNKLNC